MRIQIGDKLVAKRGGNLYPYPANGSTSTVPTVRVGTGDIITVERRLNIPAPGPDDHLVASTESGAEFFLYSYLRVSTNYSMFRMLSPLEQLALQAE